MTGPVLPPQSSTASFTKNQSTHSLHSNDLWDLLQKRKTSCESGEGTGHETTVVILGPKESGKTLLVSKFLERDETPAPTVGLEYTFARKTRGMSNIKDVAHFWEVAGGKSLVDLATIPITDTNIHTSALVITVDLSKPWTVFPSLQHFLSRIDNHISYICNGLEKRNSKRPTALRINATKKYGNDNPDKSQVEPLLLPTMIVATKYDLFKNTDAEKRKLMAQMLRWFAHNYGATLLYVSHNQDPTRFRQCINNMTFKAAMPKVASSVDHTKPIFVPAGSDSFLHIGLPPSMSASKDTLVRAESWKRDFEALFPRPRNYVDEDEAIEALQVDLSKYSEPLIDAHELSRPVSIPNVDGSSKKTSKR